MEDRTVWALERSLWTGDADRYLETVDDQCLMVVPAQPYILTAAQVIEAIRNASRWTEVAMSRQTVSRPQDGLIVVAYTVEASRNGGDPYRAWCTSTYRRLALDQWHLVQHQQTPGGA